MTDQPPRLPDRRYSGQFRRRDVDYCRELRKHVGEFRETRRRLVGALVVVLGLSLVTFATGSPGIGGFLVGAGVIVGCFAVFNEAVLYVTRRKLERDCPEFDQPRRIA